MSSAATLLSKSLRHTLGIKSDNPARRRDSHWYSLPLSWRIVAATFGVSIGIEGEYTRKIFADPDASEAENRETPESLGIYRTQALLAEAEDDLSRVCIRLEMLHTILNSLNSPNAIVPLMGGIYLNTARQAIWQLRNGLTLQRITKTEALRLLDLIEHNLREADKIHRHQLGLSLDEALRNQIGDLLHLGDDISGQIPLLRQMIVRLFEETDQQASLTPIR